MKMKKGGKWAPLCCTVDGSFRASRCNEYVIFESNNEPTHHCKHNTFFRFVQNLKS